MKITTATLLMKNWATIQTTNQGIVAHL